MSQFWLLTFTTYGSWLRGDDRGAHDRSRREGALAPNGPLHTWQVRAMAQPHRLDAPAREIVVRSIQETCAFRCWDLRAVHVREEHVHVVCAPDTGTKAARAVANLKSWSTRRLREAARVDADRRVWSRHGSTRRLWSDVEVAQAVRYVAERQGVPMACWWHGMAGLADARGWG